MRRARPARPRNLRWLKLPARSAAAPPPVRQQARILGLDPGSLATGYAVIECRGTDSTYLASGVIRTKGASFPLRLQEIFSNVAKLMTQYRPDEVAIERIFVHRNADSALKLGQARGAALSATFDSGSQVYEYAAREVKLAVVGAGSAQKDQVQLMVKQLLQLREPLSPDAADALAIALCHAHSRRLASLLARAGNMEATS
jgi:crossover junction endodeoxyribonuclease RuvC